MGNELRARAWATSTRTRTKERLASRQSVASDFRGEDRQLAESNRVTGLPTRVHCRSASPQRSTLLRRTHLTYRSCPMRRVATLFLLSAACATAGQPPAATAPSNAAVSYSVPAETHLPAPRRLTDGGENAEAYWSFDGQ